MFKIKREMEQTLLVPYIYYYDPEYDTDDWYQLILQKVYCLNQKLNTYKIIKK